MNAKADWIKIIVPENLIEYIDDVNMVDRDKEIVREYVQNGLSYRKLGELYEISGERVRQILTKFAKKALHIRKKREKEN